MRNKHKFAAAFLGLAMAASVAVSLASAETKTSTPSDPTVKTNPGKGKLDAVKQKVRVAKATAISKLATNQTNRAQTALDKLSKILDRIEALRDKIENSSNSTSGTSTSTPSDSKIKPKTINTATLDALITTAEKQKVDAQKAIDDLNAKATALQKALADAATNTTDSSAVAPTHPVQDFIKSMITVKKDLIALHKTLQQIVPVLKSSNGEDKSGQFDTKTKNNTSTSTAGDQEND